MDIARPLFFDGDSSYSIGNCTFGSGESLPELSISKSSKGGPDGPATVSSSYSNTLVIASRCYNSLISKRSYTYRNLETRKSEDCIPRRLHKCVLWHTCFIIILKIRLMKIPITRTKTLWRSLLQSTSRQRIKTIVTNEMIWDIILNVAVEESKLRL